MECDKVSENDRKSCDVMNNIKKSYLAQDRPAIHLDLELDGKASSSFFYKWGSCITKDNLSDCIQKGYQYLDGKCYKSRYHYLSNRPGIDLTKINDNTFTQMANKLGGFVQGNMPSVVGDILSFTPNQLQKVYNQEQNGDYIPEPCNEHFTNNIGDSYFRIVACILGLTCIVAFFIWLDKKMIR